MRSPQVISSRWQLKFNFITYAEAASGWLDYCTIGYILMVLMALVLSAPHPALKVAYFLIPHCRVAKDRLEVA